MAKEKTVNKGRVAVSLSRARIGEEASLFVGINGVSYIVPKGKTVDVKPEVAEEIYRAKEADDRMHAQAEAMQKQGE